uniref:Protocadherin gamma subfamily C, 3 n=1 Tax=Serinus canaria TaxID=9135 RepID=A0A8C9N2W6_SERCA
MINSADKEARRGSAVGNVVADLALDLERLPERRLRVVSGGNKKYFGVDLKSGALLVNERIDREELCGALSPCSLSFEIVVENPLELFSGTVEIQDINDNDPVFPSSQARLEISESVAAGARFPLESAQDPDVGINSLQTYQLSANPNFALDVQTRVDGSKYAELVLEKELDREEQRELNLVLTALDGGSPPRSAHVQIHIDVVDANDNAPVFNQSTYKASVRENTPSGTLVARISAYDLDDGPNGDIIYSFSSHTPAKVRELFALDSATGELRVKGQLDYEETKLYEIYLQAKDKGAVPGVAHCKVLVEVVDVNDNAPEVTVTSVYSPVPEDAAPGTVVALLSVTDLDSHDNGLVNCFISPGIPFMLSSSLKNYYTLKTEGALDREKAAEYNITITAKDSGSPPLSAVKHILVQVSDVNDNAPRSSQDSYDVYVLENNMPGIPILNVSATDPDLGRNAHLSYTLLESGQVQDAPISSFVHINPDNGNLYAQRTFDFELLQVLPVSVVVRDSGSPPLYANVTVYIFVLDQNDHVPTILHPASDSDVPAPQRVPLSAPPGYLVAKVTAVDADAGHNAWLSYRLLPQSTDPSLFHVSLYTGEVRTARAFQDSDMALQQLLVLVTDNGDPPLSTTATITVALEEADLEESFKPQDFLAGTKEKPDLTFYLIIALAAISTVALATVTLLAARCLRRRGRAAVSPYCCCCTRLDREHVAYYNVTVSASDLGNPPLSRHTILPITLIDVNDNAPQFEQASYEVLVAENNPVGSVLVTVSAADPDSEQNSRLSYSILRAGGTDPGLDPTRYLSIHPTNGQVTAKFPFDYEQTTYLQFHVEVSDGGSPALRNRTLVHVFVVDQNDNAPRVHFPRAGEDSATQFRISPSVVPPALITKVVAIDADSGRNAWLSYHLVEATDLGLFSVALRSGEVRIMRALQETDASEHELLVVVRDAGEPPLSTAVTLVVLVEEKGPEALQGSEAQAADGGGLPSITLYLIVSLVLISTVSLVALAALGIRCLRRGSAPANEGCCVESVNTLQPPPSHIFGHLHYEPKKGDTVMGVQVTATAPPAPRYRSCFSPVSDISEFMFVKPSADPTLCSEVSSGVWSPA